MSLTVAWGSAPWDPTLATEKSPKPKGPVPSKAKGTIPMPENPEMVRYLADRLIAIADTACNYREYKTMPVTDRQARAALADGLDTVAKSLREVIIEMTDHDPWANHPEGAAP